MRPAGEVTSFGELYKRYAADVYRFALGLTGRVHEAEDIVSETFLRVWNSSAPVRASTVRAYLLKVARNLFLENLRKRGREQALDFDVTDTRDLAREQESRDEWIALRAALERLKEEDRCAILMHAILDIPYEEISSVLGVPVATLKVKVHRARLELGRVLEREAM